MNCKIAFLFCVPFLSHSAILEGVARNPKGDIVYLEKHIVENDEAGLNTFINVEYTKKDNTVFATMTSDFSKNKTVPETVFIDKRFNSKTTVRISSKEVIFDEIQNDKVISQKSFLLRDTMVSGQGFDNFIKINRSKLLKEKVTFKFGVLENKDFYSLSGYQLPTRVSTEIEYGIRAAHWITRFFSEELRVVYDSNLFRIKTFSGRSNILDDSKKAQNVTIQYTWKEKI